MKTFDQIIAIIGGTAISTIVLPSEQDEIDAPEVTILPYPYPIQNHPSDLPNSVEPEEMEEMKDCSIESAIVLNLF